MQLSKALSSTTGRSRVSSHSRASPEVGATRPSPDLKGPTVLAVSFNLITLHYIDLADNNALQYSRYRTVHEPMLALEDSTSSMTSIIYLMPVPADASIF